MSLLKFVVTATYSTGGTAQEVFHYECDNDLWTDINVGQMLEDFASNLFGSLLLNLLTTTTENLVYNQVEVFTIEDIVQNTWIPLGDLGVSEAGSATGDAMPEQIAQYIYAPRIGGGRGASKFLGGCVEAQNVDGNIGAGALSNLLDFAAGWVAPFSGALTGFEFTPVCYSPTEGNTFELTGSFNIATIYSNQVRRRRDIGM